MARKWTEEQKEAARVRMKEMNKAKKSADTTSRVRVPMGAQRDVTAVHSIDNDEYVGRWVNDVPGRVERFKQAGYDMVESASVGDSRVDGTHNESGCVSLDVGKGTTAYLMKQRRKYFDEDQQAKQKIVDESEESIRRNKNDNRNDGFNGEIKIG